jgi:hypothetical protein
LAAGLAVSVCRATWWPEQSKSVKASAKNPSGKKQKPFGPRRETSAWSQSNAQSNAELTAEAHTPHPTSQILHG